MKKLRDKIKYLIYKYLIEPPLDKDLDKKETYNQKIQWLLINDKNPLKVLCSDKLKVKEYIEEKLGSSKFTPKTHLVANDVEELINKISVDSSHPDNYFIKANNNSGNVVKIQNNRAVSEREKQKLTNSKYFSYGNIKGEWFYSGIKYKCFSEEFLTDNISDYKIHCSGGEPRFCQYIWDRKNRTKEICVDLEGNVFDFHLDTNFLLVKNFVKPKNWERMLEIANTLCKDFSYVRVDMYNINTKMTSDDSIFVGELTFAPRAGRYPGDGQIEAGKLLKGI